MRPLIKGQLLSLWKLAMANEYKHLEWSEQYLRKRELHLKWLQEKRRAENVRSAVMDIVCRHTVWEEHDETTM